MQNKYKFTKDAHLHLIWDESIKDYRALTGTTSIIEVLGKPLTYWASGLACEKLGWLNPKKATQEERDNSANKMLELIRTFSTQSYIALLDEAYHAHANVKKEKADEGTELHEALEKYVKQCIKQQDLLYIGDNTKVQKFANWAYENLQNFIASEVNVYDEGLWLGGIVDCMARTKDGKLAIVDFKSSKDAYFSQFVQCALYDLQLANGYYDAEGNKKGNVEGISKYIICPFGAKEFAPTIIEQTNFLKEAAKACITLYRCIASFDALK